MRCIETRLSSLPAHRFTTIGPASCAGTDIRSICAGGVGPSWRPAWCLIRGECVSAGLVPDSRRMRVLVPESGHMRVWVPKSAQMRATHTHIAEIRHLRKSGTYGNATEGASAAGLLFSPSDNGLVLDGLRAESVRNWPAIPNKKPRRGGAERARRTRGRYWMRVRQ